MKLWTSVNVDIQSVFTWCRYNPLRFMERTQGLLAVRECETYVVVFFNVEHFSTRRFQSEPRGFIHPPPDYFNKKTRVFYVRDQHRDITHSYYVPNPRFFLLGIILYPFLSMHWVIYVFFPKFVISCLSVTPFSLSKIESNVISGLFQPPIHIIFKSLWYRVSHSTAFCHE